MVRPGALRGPEIAPGALGGSRLSIPGSSGVYFSQFTTTDTTQFVRAVTGTLYVPGLGQYVITPISLQAKHSVADAEFSIYMSIYTTADYSGSSFATFLHGLTSGKALRLPNAADKWMPINVVGVLYPDIVGIDPGERAYDLVVRNWTAGTLTIGAGDGYDFVSWNFFGYKPG